MNCQEILLNAKPFLTAVAGGNRYGYSNELSDADYFMLSKLMDYKIMDEEKQIDYFIVSVSTLRACWGHPLLMDDLSGECNGNEKLCTFLREHRNEIAYAAPSKTVSYGLGYIADGERYTYYSPIKAGLRTAFFISHMAQGSKTPFALSDEEKAVLIRARTGEVPPEERAEIYRRTICPENLDKLRRMPENTKVRDELFALLDKICKEETP